MRTHLTAILALGFLLTAGCGKEQTQIPTLSAAVNPTPTPGPGPGGLPTDNWGGGSTVALSNVNSFDFIEFFNTVTFDPYSYNYYTPHLPNYPLYQRININLANPQSAITVAYNENMGGYVDPTPYRAQMGTRHPYNYYRKGIADNSQNGWTTWEGKPVYKGFFQDSNRAVIIVIDDFGLMGGDGELPPTVNGSIWYLTFTNTFPYNWIQGNEKMCWQIVDGPYDCRSFLVNNSMQMQSSLYPNNVGPVPSKNGRQWKKLGDFYNLNRAAAGLN